MLFKFLFLQHVVCVRVFSKRAEEKHLFRHAGLVLSLGSEADQNKWEAGEEWATSLGHHWVKWEGWAVARRPLGSGGGCRQVAASQSVRLVQCSDVNFPGEGGGHGWPGWLGWFPLVPSLNAAAPGSGFEVIAVVMLNKNFEIRKFIKNSQVSKMVSLLKSSQSFGKISRGF